jgi:hypothetical protein
LIDSAGTVLASSAAEGSTNQAQSARLDAAHMLLVEKLRLAKDEAWNAADEAGYALASKFVPGDIRASRLGNLRAVIEDYTRTAYQVHFSYLWPRLQAVLSEGDAVAPTLERAKAQLEFAVVMIGGTALTGGAWMAVVLAWRGPAALFIALGAGTPLLIGFFYRVALEGQKAFTEMVRAAIDTKRLDLLGTLGAARPEQTAAERELWRKLQDLSLGIQAEIPLKKEGGLT